MSGVLGRRLFVFGVELWMAHPGRRYTSRRCATSHLMSLYDEHLYLVEDKAVEGAEYHP